MGNRIAPCLGIPVRIDLRATYWFGEPRPIANSQGIFRWKEIVVGPLFMQFPSREQMAMLLHEAAHCLMRHHELRILNLWRIFWPPSMFRYCRAQEYAADRFVLGMGYGPDFARMLSRVEGEAPWPMSLYHPPRKDRIERLIGQMPGRLI